MAVIFSDGWNFDEKRSVLAGEVSRPSPRRDGSLKIAHLPAAQWAQFNAYAR
jgi:hypothetical protein